MWIVKYAIDATNSALQVKVVAYNLFEIIFPPISDRSHFDGGFIVPQGIGYHFSVSSVYILSLFLLTLTTYWFVGP